MDLSIILVSWNTRDLLARCLDSLFRHAGGLEWEAIVIDNDSQDGTQRMLKERFPQVCLVENSANLGFAAANNIGIRASRGRYVFLLNSDTRIGSNIPLGVVQFLDDHPQAGAVGCRLVEPGGTPQAYAYGRDPTLSHLIVRNLARFFPAQREAPGVNRLVDWVSGAAVGARRAAVERIGLLDESIHMYFEDVDLCLRLRKAGWQVWLAPNLEVVHHGGGAPINSGRRRGIYYHSLQYFYRKHYGGLQAGILSLLLLGYRAGLRIKSG